MDKYADIRPYNDEEVTQSVARLIADDDFVDLIAKHKLPPFIASIKALSRPIARWQLRRKWGSVNDVKKVQLEVLHYLENIIEQTTSQVTFSGLEKLEKDGAYLFISNHRDIVLDPALVNYGLHHSDMNTVRIAIGDNLLQIPYITELMRLNKSFIVKRSAKAPKEMLKALSHLSAYIYDSLQSGHSIWIAQREGRTKDGFDQTDPALLKMLQLQGRKQKKAFADYVRELKVVPVAISYQFEPCAIAKANEQYLKQRDGKYEKAKGEDIKSIVEGFTSNKGHVHLAFGEPITSGCDTPDELAQTIDRHIVESFYLHPGNYVAANHADAIVSCEAQDIKEFDERMRAVPEHLRDFVTAIYARPVTRKEEMDHQ